MTYGDIGGLDKPVSRLVLGGFSIDRMDTVRSKFDAFLAAGGNAVDTGHVYGEGSSERAIGKWLLETGRREEIVIITKGVHPNLSDWVTRVNPVAIAQDLSESRERLGVETVDLYLLHRDDPDAPVGPLVECLNEHTAAGRIRAFGVSNWTHSRIEEANAYAAARGLLGFSASSPHLALAAAGEFLYPGCVSVSDDADALAWYRENRFPLLAWSSQAGGFFSGRFTPEVRENAAMVGQYYSEDNWERLRRARSLAQRRGCTPTQAALAWILHQPLNIFAIFSTNKMPHLAECLAALDIRLTPKETAWLSLQSDDDTRDA